MELQGLSPFRVPQILRWVYLRGISDFEEMSNVGRHLRRDLAEHFRLDPLPPARAVTSADGATRLLFRWEGGGAVESVIIPDGDRLTVCVSSQIGCAMGCDFCATARLGLERSLSAAEIAGQLVEVRRWLGPEPRISNVVFMGMGEPLHNYDNVVEAIGIMQADWGFGLSGRRITVSTVGLLPQLRRLASETDVAVAVSLTAARDALRDRLMPVNQRYPLEQLAATCRTLPIAQRRRITFEYVLLQGVNDSADDAAQLTRLLAGIRGKVNLIPFNPFPGTTYRAPQPFEVRRFQNQLLARGLSATVRKRRGDDVNAACGQLAAAAVS